MSASLVGSEMCIRDSPFPVANSKRDRIASESRAPANWIARSSLLGDRPPVSYTHLTLPTICSV
eukprot:10209976-Alexandrium_andersonii.AAC.1